MGSFANGSGAPQVSFRLNNHIRRQLHRVINGDRIGIHKRHPFRQPMILNAILQNRIGLGHLLAVINTQGFLKILRIHRHNRSHMAHHIREVIFLLIVITTKLG